MMAFTTVLTVLCYSCEKPVLDNDTEGTGEQANLILSVKGFNVIPFDDTRSSIAVGDYCSRLNFVVYQDGKKLKAVNQEKGASGFGQVAITLEPGSYQVLVLAHSANGNPVLSDATKIQFTNATGYTDTYIYYSEVTIGEDAVDMQVSLDRIVALCRFVVTDDIPADVCKMQFYYTGGSGAFDAATGLGSVASKQTVTVDVTDGSQKQFDLYTFLHELSDNIALKVTALDASGNVLYERSFDVPMEQNHITWLSGAFFNGSGSSSTTITGVTVNTDWAGETHLTF